MKTDSKRRAVGRVGLRLALLLILPAGAAAQEPKAELRAHTGRVETLSFTSDGRRLVSGGSDGLLAVWDADAGAIASFRTSLGPIPAVIQTGGPLEAVAVAPAPPADPLRIGTRRTPERTTLVTVGMDRNVTLWDGDAGVLLVRLPALAKPIVGLSFDAEGRMLATAAWDGQRGARLFEVATGTDRASFHEYVELPRSISFAPDGKRVALGDFDGRITLLAHRPGGWLLQNLMQGHVDTVWNTSFSPDGTLLASGGGRGDVRLWSTADGGQVGQIDGAHRGGVRTIIFAPDGRTIATGGVDGVVRLWDVAVIQARGVTPPPADAPPTPTLPIGVENDQP